MSKTRSKTSRSKDSAANTVEKASEKLVRSTMIVSVLTMLSRILGLVRDMVLMSVFGAGGLMDAFLVAFKIPNFLRRLFAEGAFSQAFVPVLTQYKNGMTLFDIQVLVSRVAGALLLILSALTAIIIVAAPWVISIFAIGFNQQPEKFALTTALLRLTFPYLLFISMTAFVSSILQSYQRFAMPAFAPVLLNVTMIIAAIWVSPKLSTPIMALGYAVALAGILQLLIQLPQLHQQQLLVMPKIDFTYPGVKQILTLMLPAIFGVSVTQINLLINTVFASMMTTGSVTWLYSAERLSELPLGLIGVAIGTVILPSLSASAAKQDNAEFIATMDWAARLVVLVGLPAASALLIISPVLMVALFQHCQFNSHDAAMSGLALQCLSGGILAFMLIKIFAPAFFARQDSRTPVMAGVVAMVSNIILSAVFIGIAYLIKAPLHTALGLANTAAAFINAALLYYFLHRQGIFRFGAHWRRLGLQFLLANVVMMAVLAFGVSLFPLNATPVIRVMALLALCITGAVVYGAVLLLSGFQIKQLRH